MKISVLDKRVAKAMMACDEEVEWFAFGGDDNEDPPKVRQVRERRSASKRNDDDDEEDDDDEDDYINDPRDRRIRKLSRESNRRRIQNREQKATIAEKEEEIAELRAELKNAEKLQRSYDKLKGDYEGQQSTVRRMAIRQAIERDALEDGTKRSWYDVNMVEGQLDYDKLSVDLNDFTVGGLSDQLSALAEEKPFLVKASETQGDGKKPGNSPSGQAPQSSATGTQEQDRSATEAQMLRDFPALGL